MTDPDPITTTVETPADTHVKVDVDPTAPPEAEQAKQADTPAPEAAPNHPDAPTQQDAAGREAPKDYV